MKALLFDWDGVLADSAALYLDLYREACRRWGKVLPIDTVEQFRRWYNPRWELNYYEMGFTAEEFAEVQRWAEQHLDYGEVELFPGVEEALRSLAGDYSLAIVSTTPTFLIRTRLAKARLEGLFQHFTGGEDGSSEKADKIRLTLEALGADGGIMVGDTPLDVEAAREHGLRTVAVTYGWCAEDRIRAAGPDRTVENPLHLERAIRSLLAQG